MFCLDSVGLIDIVLNFIPFNQRFQTTFLRAGCVLEVRHLDLVLNLSHACSILGHRHDLTIVSTFAQNFVPVGICLQNGVFLSFEQKVRWTHLHTLNVSLVFDAKSLEQVLSETQHALLLIFLSCLDHFPVALPALVSEMGPSLLTEGALLGHTHPCSVIDDHFLELTSRVTLEVPTVDQNLASEQFRLQSLDSLGCTHHQLQVVFF